MAPAASVPMPTSQIRMRMPPKRPWTFEYSSSRLKWPKARLSSGATLWRARSSVEHLLLGHRGRHARAREVTANQPTRSPKLKARWKVVNGTKMVCASRSASSPDCSDVKTPDHLEVDAAGSRSTRRSDPRPPRTARSRTRVPITATLRRRRGRAGSRKRPRLDAEATGCGGSPGSRR